MEEISRRRFLKVLGAGTAAATAYELWPRGPLLRALTDEEKAALQVPQEQWLPTICGQCPAGCGILVRVVDGRAVKIDGLPSHPSNRTNMPKGPGRLQVLIPIIQAVKRGAGRGDWQAVSGRKPPGGEPAVRSQRWRTGSPPCSLPGVCGQMEGLLRRFCQAYGTQIHIDHDSISMSDRLMATSRATAGSLAMTGRIPTPPLFRCRLLEAYQPTVATSGSMVYRRGAPTHA
jgi:hypothetical protein